MEEQPTDLAALLPGIAGQMRGLLSNLYLAAAQAIPAERREQDAVLDSKAAVLEQSFYRLLRMVNGISATEYLSEKSTLSLRDTDIVQLVSAVCEASGDLAEMLGIRLRFVCAMERCICAADAAALEQALYQLLSNALKYTPKNGTVTVELKRSGKQLLLSVADTGCGIPAERKDAVFERFVKLNSFKQGTGLGLSICRTIVEHLGGNIGVESEEGKGSTFWFTLPYVPGKQEPAKIPAQMLQTVPTVEKDKLVILIAEDNESNYRLFESILRHEYKLLHAWNGREAVDLFNRYTPHLVLMDINMPEMDGYEATAQIRKQSADVPIIAVTAFAFASDEQKVLSSGFDGYMPKPINARQLKTQVLDMLRKRMTLI